MFVEVGPSNTFCSMAQFGFHVYGGKKIGVGGEKDVYLEWCLTAGMNADTRTIILQSHWERQHQI